MKNWLIVIGLLFCSATQAAELDEKLKVFVPYLGTWETQFESGKYDVSHWEEALNGTAVRALHSIADGEYGGESLIFWDKTLQKLVFYYFTTAGFYTQGTMEMIDGKSFVAYEDVTGNKDGITKVKSTSDYKDGKFTVSTSYFKNGAWSSAETRTYKRSEREVKFK